MACIRLKCQNPCASGICAIDATCSVQNHQLSCTCPPGTTGDPYRYCSIVRDVYKPVDKNPCSSPSPCGSNTHCRVSGKSAQCECISGYYGDPYGASGCKPECVGNSDCVPTKACTNYKCVDPCAGNLCGYRAICQVINHSPFCTCPDNMVGNPFSGCTPSDDMRDPCNPSPCLRNGICKSFNGKSSCEYPECLTNDDCPLRKACVDKHCVDPCLRACGENAICNVVNHKAGNNF